MLLTTPVETGASLKTLVLTDLVRSTHLIEELGDSRTAELFARHDAMARELVACHEGLEIDKADGFLLLFDRPLGAVCFALAYHEELARWGEESGIELAARVGIHLGEVFLRTNPSEHVARGAKPIEVEGLAKPIAARLMSLAEGHQTLLTRGAFELARRAAVDRALLGPQVSWVCHGAYRVAGLELPLRIFEVGVEGFAPLTPPADTAKARQAQGEGTLAMQVDSHRLSEEAYKLRSRSREEPKAREAQITGGGPLAAAHRGAAVPDAAPPARWRWWAAALAAVVIVVLVQEHRIARVSRDAGQMAERAAQAERHAVELSRLLRSLVASGSGDGLAREPRSVLREGAAAGSRELVVLYPLSGSCVEAGSSSTSRISKTSGQ